MAAGWAMLCRLARFGHSSRAASASTWTLPLRTAANSLTVLPFAPSPFQLGTRVLSCASTPVDNGPTANGRFGHFRSAALVGALALGSGLQVSSKPASCEGASPVKENAKTAPTLTQKCMAEAFGTGVIVHGGCGVVASKMYAGSGLGTFQLAGIWALSIMMAIFSTREISGAHLNPAVSVTLAVNKDFSAAELGPYVLAQTVGAFIAGAVNYGIMQNAIKAFELAEKVPRGTSPSTFAGAFGMVPNAAVVGPLGAFLAEVWMTALFVFMVFTVTDPEGSVPKDAAPAFIGLFAGVMISIFGPITGCGMNPARDLGPRLVTVLAGWGSVAWQSAWLYTVGPVIGAVLGGFVYQQFFREPNKQIE